MFNKVSLFIVLLFSVCLSLFADEPAIDRNQYRLYIESVNYTDHNNGVLAFLTLSNGSTWKFKTKVDQDQILYNFQKEMQPGCEVTLNVADYPTYEISSDGNSFYSISIDKDTFSNLDQFPVVVKIEERSGKRFMWIFPTTEYHVFLSDNSHWKSSDLSFIQEGDPIIISRQNLKEFESWYLFNVTGKLEERPIKPGINLHLDTRAWQVRSVNVIEVPDSDTKSE